MRVFHVEDSPAVVESLNRMLEAIPGVSVAGHASDAPHAIAGILRTRPDVVVTDVLLEGCTTGLEVLQAVREREPRIDFYFLSNVVGPYREVALKLGAQGYFDKYLEFERLRDVVADRALQLHKQGS